VCPKPHQESRLESHHDNTIELAFAKLKELLRKQGARTIEALWQAIGNIYNLFTPSECWNFFRHDGYIADFS
jgi:transposase